MVKRQPEAIFEKGLEHQDHLLIGWSGIRLCFRFKQLTTRKSLSIWKSQLG
jgi:hypothetical protein